MEASGSDYIFEATSKEEGTLYVDAKREDCCYGRYVNDPLDDTLVNAKVIT